MFGRTYQFDNYILKNQKTYQSDEYVPITLKHVLFTGLMWLLCLGFALYKHLINDYHLSFFMYSTGIFTSVIFALTFFKYIANKSRYETFNKNENEFISHYAENKLNQIVVFKDGMTAPLYSFIDYFKSTNERLIVNISYDSVIVDIRENQYSKYPTTDENHMRNKELEQVNKIFGYLKDKDLYDYVIHNRTIFDETNHAKMMSFETKLEQSKRLENQREKMIDDYLKNKG